MSSPSAAVTADRPKRAIQALASLAWAFLSAQTRNDTARATQILQIFQQGYNQYSAEVRSLSPSTAQGLGMPSTLKVDGLYGSNTRLVMQFCLVSQYTTQGWAAALSEMPAKLAGLAGWFTAKVKAFALATDDIWTFDVIAQNQPIATVRNTVDGMFYSFVDQGTTPGASIPAQATDSQSNTEHILDQAPPVHVSPPPTRSVDLAETDIYALTAPKSSSGLPTWALVAIGAGVLTFGGLGIYYWRKNKKRGRR